MIDTIRTIPGKMWRLFVTTTDGHNSFLYRTLLALALLSTTVGVVEYYLAGKAITGFVVLNGILVFLLVSVFVGVMAISIEHVFDRHNIIANWSQLLVRIGWGLMYGVLFFISLSFSFAFWWGLFSASAETKNVTETQIARDTRELGQISDSITNIARAADDQERTSARLSKDEGQEGNTCEANSGRTFGRIAKLRQDDANTTKTLASAVRAARRSIANAPQAAGQLANPQTLTGSKTASELLTDAKRFANIGGEENMRNAQENIGQAQQQINSAIRSLKSLQPDFETLAKHYEDGKETPTICRHDPTRDSFRAIAVKLKELKEHDPKKLEVYTDEKAVIEAVSRLWTPFGITGFLPGTRVAKMTDGDFLPLVFALVVDVGLMLIGFQRGDPLTRQERIAVRAEERTKLSQAIEHRLGGNLQDIQIDFAGISYFVLPDEVPSQMPQQNYLRGQVRDFLKSFDRAFSPVVEYTVFSLPLLSKLMDSLARKRLGYRHQLAGDSNIHAATIEAWGRGRNFRWYRFNRRHAELFLKQLAEFTSPEDGSDEGLTKEHRRGQFFVQDALERQERQQRERARATEQDIRNAAWEREAAQNEAEAEAMRASLDEMQDYREKFAAAQRRLTEEQLKAKLIKTELETSQLAAESAESALKVKAFKRREKAARDQIQREGTGHTSRQSSYESQSDESSARPDEKMASEEVSQRGGDPASAGKSS